jgi:hypothetical protein
VMLRKEGLSHYKLVFRRRNSFTCSSTLNEIIVLRDVSFCFILLIRIIYEALVSFIYIFTLISFQK